MKSDGSMSISRFWRPGVVGTVSDSRFSFAAVGWCGICVDGEVAKAVSGLAWNAAITTRTGLGWGRGKLPLVEVVMLGFICASVMTTRENGWMPVTQKAAKMVSDVNAAR